MRIFSVARRLMLLSAAVSISLWAQAEGPADEPKAAAKAPPPAPVRVTYDMPMDGFMAIDIHEEKSGKLVRRLIGETWRKKGKILEEWDLKDLNGQPVKPGKYFYKGLAHPQFKLTYEMSVNNAGTPAWWAPAPGKGGGSWLADHTMASAVAAQKDRIWISAPCAESGHAMIATDLDGVKQWGTGMGHFGFDGPYELAADERCGYAATKNMLFRVDPQRNFAARAIFRFPNTAELPWVSSDHLSHGGLAARDGRLYFAVSQPSSWLRPSFVSDNIDPSRCRPLVYLFRGRGRREGRDDKVYGFETYDELMLLYSTFQCDKTPARTPTLPNFPLDSSIEASFGDAPTSGPLRGSVVLAFHRPVQVGSILIPDGAIKVLAMKPKYTMPTYKNEAQDNASTIDGLGKEEDTADDTILNEFNEDSGFSEEWVPLKIIGAAGRPAIALAPPGGLKATALRFKVRRLDYGMVMGHRLGDVAPKARRIFREGRLTPAGGWQAARKKPAITEFRPAVMALSWPQKQKLRGITLMRPPGGHTHTALRFFVDCWVGSGSPKDAAALDQGKSWRALRHVDYRYRPKLYHVDFGGLVETAGIRIRFLNVMNNYGYFRAGFDAVVAYTSVGGHPKDLPPDLSQRVSVFKLPPLDDDKAPAVLEKHIPIPNAGNLAFDRNGVLHCVSGNQVVTVPLQAGETSRVVIGHKNLQVPLALAFGPDGLLYVTDNGPKIIKVFKPDTGTLVRTIGTPGGLKNGKWDPSRLSRPTGIAVDRLGRPWVADWCWAPKRVQRFSVDGKADKAFLGPTQYGGGGTMDCRDRRVIYYAGMKFVLDWEKRSWKLANLMGQVVDRTVYWQGKRYLVGPTPGGGRLVSIAEEKGNVAKLMAQAGKMQEWKALRQVKAIRDKFGGLDLDKTFFVWCDRNGDRQPQVDEVQAVPTPDHGNWTVGEDLALISRGYRLRPKRIQPDGVPIYDLKEIKAYEARIPPHHNDNPWGDERGRIFTTGAKLIDSDGRKLLWHYYNEWNVHDGFYAAGYGWNRPPGVLNWEHSPIGHLKVKNAHGVVEDYYVSNSDAGDWYCFSADGMLVGCLLGGPVGYGRKMWSMPEWEPGKMDLTDMRPGQEHYQGNVVSMPDGTVYAIAGHNHISVVRIDGLQQVTRLQGKLTVSAEDLEKTRVWLLRKAEREQAKQAPKVANMLRGPGQPDFSGSHEEWPPELFVIISQTIKRGLRRTEIIDDGLGALAFDSKNLYVAIRVRDKSIMMNSAKDPLTLFKNGDAAEITLGLDPKADPKRTAPAPGDIRLLFSVIDRKPVAVLYKPVDPRAPKELSREFSSPVGRVHMDRVEVVGNAKVAFTTRKYKEGDYWVMEAGVPWTAIGIKPPPTGSVLRGDFGYLESDAHGTRTMARTYWSAKTQTVISDLPSEARLNPSLWGTFKVIKSTKDMRLLSIRSLESMDLDRMLDEEPTADEDDIDDMLEE